MYTNPKLQYNQNFSSSPCNKNLKKSIILKKSKTYILHNNNNAEKLFKKCKKKCPINNQVTYLFFISNEFIDFSESIWIFSIFFTFLKIVKNFFLNERNVTNLGYVFVTRFVTNRIAHKNFQGDDWTNSCTIIASIFFQKLLKNWQNSQF